MELILRKADKSEVSVLQEFSKQVIDKNYRAFLGDEAVDFFINSGTSNQYIVDNMEDTLIAEMQGRVVGICVCKENLIDLIMVQTELHGQHIGSEITNQVSENLFQKYDIIRVESFESNVRANGFYKKNGWKEDKVEFDDEIGGNRIYYFRKKQV